MRASFSELDTLHLIAQHLFEAWLASILLEAWLISQPFLERSNDGSNDAVKDKKKFDFSVRIETAKKLICKRILTRWPPSTTPMDAKRGEAERRLLRIKNSIFSVRWQKKLIFKRIRTRWSPRTMPWPRWPPRTPWVSWNPLFVCKMRIL